MVSNSEDRLSLHSRTALALLGSLCLAFAGLEHYGAPDLHVNVQVT